MYSPPLLDHFEHPRHAGSLENPTAAVEVANPACGDVLRLEARIEDGRVAAVRFRAKGCVPAIACASALAELLHGAQLGDAARITRAQLVAAVGGLPEAASHASHLAMDALHELLATNGIQRG